MTRQSILFEKSFAKGMDPRVKPAGDGQQTIEQEQLYRPRGRQPPRMPGRPEVERGPGR
jgi:hypothetical protein